MRCYEYQYVVIQRERRVDHKLWAFVRKEREREERKVRRFHMYEENMRSLERLVVMMGDGMNTVYEERFYFAI